MKARDWPEANESSEDSPMRWLLSVKNYPEASWWKVLYLNGVRKGSVVDPKSVRYIDPKVTRTKFWIEVPRWAAKWIAPLLWGRPLRPKSK